MCLQKSGSANFGHFQSFSGGHVVQKSGFRAIFSQVFHSICPIFTMETAIMFYYYTYLVYLENVLNLIFTFKF